MKLKLVSLKEIANKLKQNPLMNDMDWEFIVGRAVECLSIIGTPSMYVDTTIDIQIKSNRGLLPIDLMGINMVARIDSNRNITPMRVSEDILHDDYAGLKSAANVGAGYTYTVSHSAIFTNFEEGAVLINYRTLATDEECFPLVPGQPELLRAVESYIRYKWYDILHDIDQISERKLSKVEAEYSFNVGQAQSSMIMPTVDEMETFTNEITQILPSRKAHINRFQFLGAQEHIKIQ